MTMNYAENTSCLKTGQIDTTHKYGRINTPSQFEGMQLSL